MKGINKDRCPSNARGKSHCAIYLLFDKYEFQPGQCCSCTLSGCCLLKQVFLTRGCCLLLVLQTWFVDHRGGGWQTSLWVIPGYLAGMLGDFLNISPLICEGT